MERKRLAAGAATVAALGGGGIAYATGDDAGEQATRPDIEKAKSAALDHTNGGRVTGTEVGDEEGLYEVEVTRDDGSQVDVDRDFDALGTSSDHESPDDGDGPNDGCPPPANPRQRRTTCTADQTQPDHPGRSAC